MRFRLGVMFCASALAALTGLLASCSASPAVGPLGDGGSAGAQCIHGDEGQAVTMGIYELVNIGRSPATVQRVSLPDNAHGLRMTKAWLVPITHTRGNGTLSVGAGGLFPPVYSALVRAVWAQRRPAAGAIIRPGQDLNLVFGLTRTSDRDGRSPGPAIVYSANRTTYTIDEGWSLIVSANCLTMPEKEFTH